MRSDIQMLFREHHADLLRYVRRHLDDGAEDIVSSVFELATRKLDPAHPQPAGWLFRSARNLLLAESRRRRRDTQVQVDLATLAPEPDVESDIEHLRLLMGHLAERHREVLQLTYWDELTAAEVAVVLGCTEATVWKRISRARAQLRRAWAGRSSDESDGGRHV